MTRTFFQFKIAFTKMEQQQLFFFARYSAAFSENKTILRHNILENK